MLKTYIVCILSLLLYAGIHSRADAQDKQDRLVKKTTALATACIVQPLGIGKTADLEWVWKEDSQSGSIPQHSLELKKANFEVSAHPAAVFCLTLPGSVMVHSGKEIIEVADFVASRTTNTEIHANGTFSLAVQAVPYMAKNQMVGKFAGTFEVCLAFN